MLKENKVGILTQNLIIVVIIAFHPPHFNVQICLNVLYNIYYILQAWYNIN